MSVREPPAATASQPSRGVYDVVVVGARVAGAATALLLARAGLDVLAVERGSYGSDTLSTLALMRAGVFQLRSWGVLDALRATAPPAITHTTFHYADERLDISIRPHDGVEALYAPRRRVLDRLLVDAARQAGAEVVHGWRLSDLERHDDGRVAGAVLEHARAGRRSIDARWVVGADGADSRLASLVAAPVTRGADHTGCVAYGFYAGFEPDRYHWHFRPGVAAGVIPTHDGLACVFASTSGGRFGEVLAGDLAGGFARLLDESAPELARRVGSAGREGPLHGFPGRLGYLRRPWGPGWALVGDAGYFKDPITAHGLSDALRDAELLARALLLDSDDALAAYESQRDALSGRLFDITDRIASYAWSLEEVQRLHVDLNREMSREVEALAGLPRNASWSASG